jgi:hypothetical protein
MLKKSPLKRGNSKLEKSPMKKGFSSMKKSLLSKGGLKKSGRIKSRVKSEEELIEEQLLRDKRTAFYKECAELSNGESDISGKRIGDSRIFFHHTKPKAKFPELAYCHLLILQVTMDEHSKCESDIYFYKENVEKIKFAEDNYELCKQLSAKWELDYGNKFGRTE